MHSGILATLAKQGIWYKAYTTSNRKANAKTAFENCGASLHVLPLHRLSVGQLGNMRSLMSNMDCILNNRPVARG